jgi:hypothetical protein
MILKRQRFLLPAQTRPAPLANRKEIERLLQSMANPGEW